jgi:hypothetical protein
MRVIVVALAALMTFTTPTWAEGAFALGCTPAGEMVWGMRYGEKSAQEAAPKALAICQKHGSDCTLLRLELKGNGAWLALALDSSVPRPQCAPFGEFYSASKETATAKAIEACHQDGGTQCKIALLKQNVPVMTYTVIPGGGGGGGYVPPSGLCTGYSSWTHQTTTAPCSSSQFH